MQRASQTRRPQVWPTQTNPYRALTVLLNGKTSLIKAPHGLEVGTPLLVLYPGVIEEAALGPYGSDIRKGNEVVLLETFIGMFPDVVHAITPPERDLVGQPNALYHVQFADGAKAVRARQELADMQELAIEHPVVGPVVLLCRTQPGSAPPGAKSVMLYRMPPSYRRDGCCKLVLECAGYRDNITILAEYGGGLKLSGGVSTTVSRGDIIVAIVLPPADDPDLAKLPASFGGGDKGPKVDVVVKPPPDSSLPLPPEIRDIMQRRAAARRASGNDAPSPAWGRNAFPPLQQAQQQAQPQRGPAPTSTPPRPPPPQAQQQPRPPPPHAQQQPQPQRGTAPAPIASAPRTPAGQHRAGGNPTPPPPAARPHQPSRPVPLARREPSPDTLMADRAGVPTQPPSRPPSPAPQPDTVMVGAEPPDPLGTPAGETSMLWLEDNCEEGVTTAQRGQAVHHVATRSTGEWDSWGGASATPTPAICTLLAHALQHITGSATACNFTPPASHARVEHNTNQHRPPGPSNPTPHPQTDEQGWSTHRRSDRKRSKPVQYWNNTAHGPKAARR